MADTTNIEWCDSTFNPWIGCTRVSPACDDCYAARSTPARTLGVAWGAGQPRRRTSDANWKLPEQWQRQAAAFYAQHGRRRRVFCASLADWLDNEAPAGWLVDLLQLVHATPDLDWLLLTKRIGNWRGQLMHASGMAALQAGRMRWPGLAEWICDWLDGKPPRNVWLGSTVVNQAEADRDVPKLLATPAAVRFLSVEPMLSMLEVLQWLRSNCWYGSRPGPGGRGGVTCPDCNGHGHQCQRLHWVICGGESGPKARPMHPDWARSLRDQCAAAGVPFLFKQWGEWIDDDHIDSAVLPSPHIADPEDFFEGHMLQDPLTMAWRIGKKAAGRQLDGRTHDAWPSSAA